MWWQRTLRRAADVADYVGQGAPGRHFGRWLCLNCPRDHHEPPFLPFGLTVHIREHRRRFPRHAIAWWCWDHLMVEDVHTAGWRWFYDPIMSNHHEKERSLWSTTAAATQTAPTATPKAGSPRTITTRPSAGPGAPCSWGS